MTEPPTTDGARVRPLVPATIALIVVILVLDNVFALGYLEIGLILLPLLVFGTPALAFYFWARRRGDLD